jgi:hypothetical protein
MNEQKQINYGIIGCCTGTVVGFAIGFPIFFQLPYAKRGYIGVPLMLVVVLGCCIAGGVAGVRLARKGDGEE